MSLILISRTKEATIIFVIDLESLLNLVKPNVLSGSYAARERQFDTSVSKNLSNG